MELNMNPKDLLYAETHEWVRVAQEGGRKVGTVGVTAFALEQLTDLVHMVLPKVGAQVKAGQPYGEVESVKAVSDLYSPVDGEVIAVHSDLVDKLESLPSDPYNTGWMIKVALSDESSLKKLMEAAAYEKQCAAEG
jgi:glycine cleavage system H protein